MSKLNKICIPTFSRSDYSSLSPVIIEAQKDREIELQVLVGGSHLLKRFGESVNDIKNDGIKIFMEIHFLGENDDSEIEFALAFSKLFEVFFNYLVTEKPDTVFILGDRWEMLACSQAANLLRVPIVHHSGGDLTQGSLDNQTRYVLTMQSHLHLVAIEEHKRRLVSMGEEDWRVRIVGEPALSRITEPTFLFESMSEIPSVPCQGNFVLATFHPTSFDQYSFEEQINMYIEILDCIEESVLLTAPNPDPSSKIFFDKLSDYVETKKNIYFLSNVGSKAYYTCMKFAKYMVGNSSSGIWEAPSFKLPVINIGRRQEDRLRAGNVIDCSLETEDFKKALNKIRSSEFKEKLRFVENPYVFKDTISEIVKTFKQDFKDPKVLQKKIVDPLRVKK